MTETVIKHEDVIWEMNWNQTQFPDKPATEMIFEPHLALARLLAEEVVFVNNQWWKEELPEAQRKLLCCFVNINDVFAWACSDAIELNLTDLESLYRSWSDDKRWGVVKWACKNQNLQPQEAIVRRMKASNVWDDQR